MSKVKFDMVDVSQAMECIYFGNKHIDSDSLESIKEILTLASNGELVPQTAANKATEEREPNDAELAKELLLEDLESIADYWTETVVEVYGGKSVNVGNDLREKFAKLKLTAIANTATEEGELPALPERPKSMMGQTMWYGYGDMEDYARAAIAADRASRQVANKAEVEPIAFMTSDKKMLVFADAMRKLQFDPAGMVALYEYPPATTGASTAPRPTDDELWDATLRDRDAYHDWADKLADAIAKHFGVDIGEHSNHNLPWSEALEAIENADPVGASTVLTDERIKPWQERTTTRCGGWQTNREIDEARDAEISELRAALAVAREVAAQAGQVASVPSAVAVPAWNGESTLELSATESELVKTIELFTAQIGGQVAVPEKLAADINAIADELEQEAMNYEGDFADTVKGCAEALRIIAAPSPVKESK